MFPLTARQMEVVERLFAAGMRPMAVPRYEKALCMYRGDSVALLAPVENGGLQLLAAPTLLIHGNLSVRIKRGNGEVFVFKKDERVATPELLKELETFRTELIGILELPTTQ